MGLNWEEVNDHNKKIEFDRRPRGMCLINKNLVSQEFFFTLRERLDI